MKTITQLLIFVSILTIVLTGCKSDPIEDKTLDTTSEVVTTESTSENTSYDEVKDTKIKEMLVSLKSTHAFPQMQIMNESSALYLLDWLYTFKDASYEEIDPDFFIIGYALTAVGKRDEMVLFDKTQIFPLPNSNFISVEIHYTQGEVVSYLNVVTNDDGIINYNGDNSKPIRKPYTPELHALYYGVQPGTTGLYQAGQGSDFLEDMIRSDVMYLSDEYAMKFESDSKSDNVLYGVIGPYQAGAMDFDWNGGLKITDTEHFTEYEMYSPYGNNNIKIHRFAVNMDGVMYYLVAPNVSYTMNVITAQPHFINSGGDTYYFDLSNYADGIVVSVHEFGGEIKDTVTYQLNSILEIEDNTISYNAINQETLEEGTVSLTFDSDRVVVGTSN